MSLDAFTAPLPALHVGLTGSPLDRADEIRRDAQALHAMRMHPQARWLVLDGLRPVLAADGDLLWVRRSEAPEGAEIFLGIEGTAPRFAVAGPADGLDGTATDARMAAMQLDDGRAAIIAHARSILDWHARHRFCASCGAPTEPAKAGYQRNCSGCGAQHFPRTDPVVIMLALDGDRALLGRQPSWPAGRLSALAGFVEPGESLEEAVARELFEEAGIRTGRVRYVASQPWPFPSSLMVAAFAEAATTDLRIDTVELEEARWFTRAEVRAALDGDGPFIAPPPLAIAYTLLATWAAL